MKILDLIRDRQSQQFDLHDRYLNSQMVRVLKTIGFDKSYVRAEGPYLFDAQGERYLDLLSGFGVFGIGRNHPSVIETLGEILHSELPHLVQMDVSLLSGLLAERLLDKLPGPLEKMFFCNSGTEAVEAAMVAAARSIAHSRGARAASAAPSSRLASTATSSSSSPQSSSAPRAHSPMICHSVLSGAQREGCSCPPAMAMFPDRLTKGSPLCWPVATTIAGICCARRER